jgi:hypothetical protein
LVDEAGIRGTTRTMTVHQGTIEVEEEVEGVVMAVEIDKEEDITLTATVKVSLALEEPL